MSRRFLAVSVSGGRSSAYMAYKIRTSNEVRSAYEDIAYVFANTSREDEDTLRFLGEVNTRLLGGELVFIEPVVHLWERKGTTHRVVPALGELCRDGKRFEEMIAKYGIPNPSFKHCTRELKLNPINSYLRERWPGEKYDTAVGIRADEKRRVKDAEAKGIIYPLKDLWPTSKPEILEWFSQYDWDLAIPEYLGNCVHCFKKTDTKLNAAYHACPKAFEWTKRMEAAYGDVKPATDPTPGPRKMFRNFRSTDDMTTLFNHLGPPPKQYIPTEENSGGCSESCELYETSLITDDAA